MTDSNVPQEDFQDELGDLITEALEDRVAGAEPRRSREAFIASLRAHIREQELTEQAAATEELEGKVLPTNPVPRRLHIAQAISQITGPILDIRR